MDSGSLLLVGGGQALVGRIVVMIMLDRKVREIFMKHILAVGGVSFGLFMD